MPHEVPTAVQNAAQEATELFQRWAGEGGTTNRLAAIKALLRLALLLMGLDKR